MLNRHFAYLKYIIRHKWFVYLACRKCGVPLLQAVLHDWHKFLPSEWFPYLNTFYTPDGSKKYKETAEFAQAWNAHQKRGKHHWQAWLLTWDRGETEALEMPEKYIREMVADWWGAGRAITGKWDAIGWYAKNSGKMILHPRTRALVAIRLRESAMRMRSIDDVGVGSGVGIGSMVTIDGFEGNHGPAYIIEQRDEPAGKFKVQPIDMSKAYWAHNFEIAELGEMK